MTLNYLIYLLTGMWLDICCWRIYLYFHFIVFIVSRTPRRLHYTRILTRYTYTYTRTQEHGNTYTHATLSYHHPMLAARNNKSLSIDFVRWLQLIHPSIHTYIACRYLVDISPWWLPAPFRPPYHMSFVIRFSNTFPPYVVCYLGLSSIQLLEFVAGFYWLRNRVVLSLVAIHSVIMVLTDKMSSMSWMSLSCSQIADKPLGLCWVY